VRQLPADDRVSLMHAYVGDRTNRRHKPGRAFERTGYRFDVLGDYGAFRDLQRHRMLTIEWQALTPHHGFDIPEAVRDSGLDARYEESMERSRDLYHVLADPFPEQAAYAVAFGYKLRYVMQMNAREAMHLCELRSSPQGHPTYRHIAQEMHRQIAERAGHHAIAAAMSHVDHESYDLERLDAERAAEQRRMLRT
jgi:thymidylate synthase ThyX